MTRLFILGSILFSTIFWQSPVKANEQLLEKPARKVTVQVSIQGTLIPSDVDEWVLYVYASQPGTRLPLANFKGRLSDLPREVVLHQSMYLLPHLTLQQAESVVIIAKASKSKNPHQKSSQDIIGYSTVVSFKSGPEQVVSMIIDQHDKTVIPK